MFFSRPGAAVVSFLALGLTGLIVLSDGMRLGEALARLSYDTLHAAGGAGSEVTGDSPVVVVYLDLHSFLAEKQNPNQPWPRELHARLVRQLTAAGAKAIIFDVVFGTEGADRSADREFAAALRENGRVILAGQANDDASQAARGTDAWARWTHIEPPLALFATNAAGWGLANHILDADFVVRRHFAGLHSQSRPSLTMAAAAWLGWASASEADRASTGLVWIRYYGPALSIPHVSYSQALRADGVPAEFFRDKIVFVGARPMAELFKGRQDEFRSPFHSWRHKELFMPGVEVHATAFLNLLRGDWLRRTSPTEEAMVVLLIAAIFGAGLIWLRPWPATCAALAGAGGVWAVALSGFSRGVWFPWLIVAGAQIPLALFGSWLFQFGEWFATRRRLEAERKRAEAKIREQAALIDKANDAIQVMDLSGLIMYRNPSAERLYGGCWPPPGGGKTEPGIADARDRAREATLQRGEWSGPLEHDAGRGRRRMIESRWTLIRDERGAPRAFLMIDSDVTERKQLEAESLRLQRAEVIGALASGMAHDLNNALAPVLMGAQLLQRDTGNDEIRRILGLMESSARRGADMVRQVVLFARGRQGEREALDLRPLVREMDQLIRETLPKTITITARFADDLWPVLGNATELHQVLLNLCVNARDAMPEGGTLSLVLDNAELSAEEAARMDGARAGEFVLLLVADTGLGMPPEVMARVFEPFFTTKAEKGTGLGLSTTARIVRSHDGFIVVSSVVGEGTTFEIFLPRLGGTSANLTAEDPGPPPGGRGEKILVVDDDQAVRELVRRSLEENGYTVIAAVGGMDAIALLRATANSPDAVILAASASGSDGRSLLEVAREKHPGLACLWISRDERGLPVRRDPDDRTGFLDKPFSLTELLRKLHAVLHTARTLDDGR